MSKLILGWVITFLLSISYITSYSQNNVWRSFVSYPNTAFEPDEIFCDIIKDGQLRIAPNLSEQANFISNFVYKDTICLARNFAYEARIKNNASIGGLGDFETKIGLVSNGSRTTVTLTGAAASQINTKILIGDSLVVSNKSYLVINPNDWHTVKMRFANNIFQLFIDNVEVYKSPPYGRKICNLDFMEYAMKGAGAIDWIKIYDNNDNIMWQEDFEDCKNPKRGIICDHSQLERSVTISRPCQNDTLRLTANFPALSYRWTTPDGRIDTNKTFKIINPVSGLYDLKAPVNICFEFNTGFKINLEQPISITKNVSICQGQTHQLPSKKIVNTEGVYSDTLKTKSGCDSIIVTKLIIDKASITNMNVAVCNGSYALPSGRIVNGTGIYRDTIRDTNGCFQLYDVTVKVGSNISTTTFLTLCEGQPYRLPRGQFVTSAGTYRDTFKSINGCDSIVIDVLEYTKKQPIKLSINRIDEVFEGDEIILTATAGNGTLRWFENNMALTNSLGTNATVSLKGGETTFKVTLNNLGCVSSDSIKVVALSEIKLPNAFSPNNDNQNDNFSIVTKNENLYKIIQFDVYNRMGKRVYANTNGLKGWDGLYKNEEQVSDSYVYIIVAQSPAGRTFRYTGEVLLIR
jgi:gliding motility-associated-like protein